MVRNRVIVSNHITKFRIRIKRVANLARAVLKQLKYRNTLLSVVFVSDPAMRRLNQKFLRHDWTTDVLAFPFAKGSRQGSEGRNFFVGEILISPTRAKVAAKRAGVSVADELGRYVCHGILHLSGYRDKTRLEQGRMRRAEDRLLKRFKKHVKRVI
jgi:probable rRNA maturation factor